jgi:acylphosphatase
MEIPGCLHSLITALAADAIDWCGSAQARRVRVDVISRVVIRGRVQGVGFRAWTEYRALERGLQGWVRNSRDGTVEALFVGSPEAVKPMIAACHQGPPGSRVDEIDQRDGTPDELALRRPGELFSMLPTA